jgi:hypothetical protein
MNDEVSLPGTMKDELLRAGLSFLARQLSDFKACVALAHTVRDSSFPLLCEKSVFDTQI